MERTLSVMVYAAVLGLLAGCLLVLGWYLLLGGTLTFGLKLDSRLRDSLLISLQTIDSIYAVPHKAGCGI